jgi:hypothetical protein
MKTSLADYATIQVVSGPNATQLLGPDGECLIINTDEINNVYLSNVESFNPGVSTNSIILRPLGTICVKGETWAMTLPGISVSIELAPATNWSPAPIDIATQIALSGVSLLSNPSIIINQTIVVPANGVTTLGPFAINQIGYNVGFVLTVNSGGSGLILVENKWTDQISGLTVGDEAFSFMGAATGQSYIGSGPTKGNMVSMTVTNPDIAFSITLKIVMIQNGRIYARDDWRQQSFATNPLYQNATGYNEQGNILFYAKPPGINAASSWVRYCPLYAGRISLRAASDGSQTGQIVVTALDAKLTGNAIILYEDVIPASNNDISASFSLPRSPSVVTVFNTGAANSIFECTITIDEYLA